MNPSPRPIPRFPVLLETKGETPWGDEYRYTDLYQTASEIDRLRRRVVNPESNISAVVMLPFDVIHAARQIIAGDVRHG